MYKIDKLLKDNYIEPILDIFLSLPRRAQLLIFLFINEYDANPDVLLPFLINCDLYSVNECKSPIEKIFFIAFELAQYESYNDNNHPTVFGFQTQHEIICSNQKRYFADFYFNPGVEDDGDGKNYKDYKLIIECDGHCSHSSKVQIKKDNEREFSLKADGYDVLHFSGSQIYTEPMECAYKTLYYLRKNTEVISSNG